MAVTWNPGPLNSAILRAFPPSVRVATSRAQFRAQGFTRPSGAAYRIVSPTQASIRPTGFGWIYEKGRAGGYPIFPKGVFAPRRSKARTVDFRDLTGQGYSFRAVRGHTQKLLSFGPNEAATFATGGPMAARPYVAPSGAEWARGGFQREAVKSLQRSGFGRLR